MCFFSPFLSLWIEDKRGWLYSVYSRSYGSCCLSGFSENIEFVGEVSCADVVMFLSLPLRTPTEQKKRGSFFKKSPTFFENSPTFLEKARTFFA